MPKKTKKAKLKILGRRSSHGEHEHSHGHKTEEGTPTTPESPSRVSQPMFSFRSPQKNGTPKIINRPEDILALPAIKHDLLKTIILALIACAVITALSFVLK